MLWKALLKERFTEMTDIGQKKKKNLPCLSSLAIVWRPADKLAKAGLGRRRKNMNQIPLKHGTVLFNQQTLQPTQPPEAGVRAVRACCWPLPQTGVVWPPPPSASSHLRSQLLLPPVWRLPGRDAEERDAWGRGCGEVVRLARKESDKPAGGSKRG